MGCDARGADNLGQPRLRHPVQPPHLTPWPPQTITGDPDDVGEFEERANGQL